MKTKELITLFASELEYEGNKLLPIQVKWLVDSFLERHPEAITVTDSSLLSKDIHTINFEVWAKENAKHLYDDVYEQNGSKCTYAALQYRYVDELKENLL